MTLGTVKGNIVSTRKCDNLVGFRLLLVESYYQKHHIFVAADTVGAGVGELVLVTTNSSAQYALDSAAPIDALIVGIVDAPPQEF